MTGRLYSLLLLVAVLCGLGLTGWLVQAQATADLTRREREEYEAVQTRVRVLTADLHALHAPALQIQRLQQDVAQLQRQRQTLERALSAIEPVLTRCIQP